MNRPVFIWLTALVCAVVVFGSIALVTHITLELEEEIYIKGEKEERVRDAMWAMNSHASSLLSREDARPAEDFSPLLTVFNETNAKGSLKVDNQLSPLFLDQPENVRYYWFCEVSDSGPKSVVCSPQLPNAEVVEKLAPSAIARDYRSRNLETHDKLNRLLEDASRDETLNDVNWGDFKYTNSNLSQAFRLSQRANAVDETASQLDSIQLNNEMAQTIDAQASSWYGVNKKEKVAESRAVLAKKMRERSNYKSKAGKTTYKQEKNDLADKGEFKEGQQAEAQIFNGSLDNPFLGNFRSAEVSPFVATWFGNELMLVRYVRSAKGSYVQGVWLNSELIKEELLLQAKAFLPGAKLKRVRDPIDLKTLTYSITDPNGMSRFPWILEPGEVPNTLSKITPMRLNLIIAWSCVICATVAIFIMFRGVMRLSERRASFVSSVSHELRTPLTTFKLYSEMLADGMVRDEAKKQEYLETLTREADRLTHMVENVLFFSQLEKGKAKRKVATVSVDQILTPLEPSFRMKLQNLGVEYENTISKEDAGCKVSVDVTSVDQILTNLIDNAAKYGQSDKGTSLVRVSCLKKGKYIYLRVSDNGNGVARSGSSRLFKEFHKSDIEAAHTKPGVGLGLALSRQLARASGGDLQLVECEDSLTGACFELRLSVASCS